MDWLTSFLLIFAAEIGDKSQLVCMALAVRYRALPVAVGAILAFLVLNTLAVVFGSAIANWIPELVISISVSVLFLMFGFHALFTKDDGEELEDDDLQVKSQQHIIFSTFVKVSFINFIGPMAISINTDGAECSIGFYMIGGGITHIDITGD